MITINKDPKARELSQFGIIWLPALMLVMIVLFTWRLQSPVWTLMLAVGMGLSIGLGIFIPMMLKPVFVGLQYVTWPVGLVVSYFLLAMVYFILMTPLAFLLRLFGYDPMRRRMPFGTMWLARPPVVEHAGYFRQF